MAKLLLKTEQNYNYTYVPNTFIDIEMCSANGDFVKIYLYLLRCMQKQPQHFSVSYIADRFELTEKDVMRALRYWENKGLLTLYFTDGELSCICLNDAGRSVAPPISDETAASIQDKEPSGASDNGAVIYPRASLAKDSFKYYLPGNLSSEEPPESSGKKTDSMPEPKSVRQPASSAANAYQTAAAMKPDTSQDNTEGASLSLSSQRIQEILFLTEQYLGKPLTADETMKICYFHDTLHFSPDLIEYLIEYCVTNNKKSMRYIEKVALSWADKGIRTVSEAKEEGAAHNKDYFEILKAFGIRDRYPVENEIEYMKKWLGAYHFDLEIILEACARTMKKGSQAAPFSYADRILGSWYRQGVCTLKDIRLADEAHSRKKSSAPDKPGIYGTERVAKLTGISKNQFTDFEQRSYDYEQLENKLSQL